ncbi:MAG: TonB-dependent receptor [Ignavibacteriae bacterium]|nr:TonB-dependent receptor [Ignavibacteriota bacterium]
MRTVLVTCLIAVLCGTAAVHGGTTGKIAGKVTDARTGEPLIGVNVLVVGMTLGASSDVEGEYYILNVPPGTYTIKASSVGYAPMTVNAVRVTVDQTTRIPFQLGSQTVEMGDVLITAERPIVQKDLTSTTSSVSGDEIAALPLEDVASVVNLQAGVVDGHFRGGRSNEVKYLIDGVAVNDVFSGGYTMQAEVNSIAEVQVLSGTFNAEYGEAMSGIVNQVTKIAGERYTGEASGYIGGYMSNRTDLFTGRAAKKFLGFLPDLYSTVYNVQASLSGPLPVLPELFSFFASGRSLDDHGSIYGTRQFNPSDSSNFSANDPAAWHIGNTGDGTAVAMNSSRRLTLQAKLQAQVGSGKGIVLQGLYQQNTYREYDHAFRLNPDGDYERHQTSVLVSGGYTHVFGGSSFLDATGSVYVSDYKQYVFENPYDARYVNPERLQDAGGNSFLTGGTANWHFKHTTTTATGRLDFTSQLTAVHQFKMGVEAQLHTLKYEDFQIRIDATTGYRPQLPPVGSFDFNAYTNHPKQFAAYIQDKIELEYLVVNAGLRFDYFEPDGMTLVNADSIASLDTMQPPYSGPLFAKAKAKFQISPRFGISYPITDRGAVHLSYGHFFQIPAFSYLYKNPSFRIPLTGNYPEFVGNTIGNADLEPQRTTMYEIGLQQEIAPAIGVTLTGYYKDIRNLLGLEIHTKNDFKKYGKYVNRNYGSVRGITVSFEKRLTDGFGANVDYTYQIARGDASDPSDDYNKAQASPPIESNRAFVPLSWDRRHSLNATLTMGTPGDFIASVIARFGSGLPYTPSLVNQRTGLENSDNRPAILSVDLYGTKEFELDGLVLSVFVKVYNVFDTANELNVFGDTGRAGYTLELTRAQEAPRGANTLAQYYTRPDFYSAPRQVVVGASVGF